MFSNPFKRKPKTVQPQINLQQLREYAVDDGARFAFEEAYRSWLGRWSGSKHEGLYGPTTDYRGPFGIDYHALRTRSDQQEVENMYAAQVTTRLLTNVINTGLTLHPAPVKWLINPNMSDDDYKDWCKKTRTYFELWGDDETVDWRRERKFGDLQIAAFHNAMIDGDCLVLLRFDQKTGLPQVELVPGCMVNSLLEVQAPNGNRILHGVEMDAQGRVEAYWVTTFKKGVITPVRVPKYGSKTGRLMAFMVYSTPLKLGKVRGIPIMSRILSSLDQIADYTGAELDAAKLNAMLAMFIKKTQDRPGSNPLGGITSRVEANEQSQGNTMGRTYMRNGTIFHELAYGEEPSSHKTDRPNVNFGAFVQTIVEHMAASLEIPPEILMLKFTSSYSASRQAQVEFKMYIDKARSLFASQFNQNIYNEWLKGMVLKGRISAPGYIEAIGSKDIFIKNAWQNANYMGAIKQNVDILKEINAFEKYIANGLMSRTQVAELLLGTDYQQVVEMLEQENEELAETKTPLEVGTISTQNELVE